MEKYQSVFDTVCAAQWFPGTVIDGVQETAYDPGDGSTKSSGYAMFGEHMVRPGDWIVDTRMAQHVFPDALFREFFDPV